MQSLKGLSKRILVNDRDIKNATRPVSLSSYKYSRGSVLVVVTSLEWRGAGILAAYAAKNALAALRTVSGFVTVAAPRGLMDVLTKTSPVFVLKQLSEDPKGRLREIMGIKHDALVLGPGVEPDNVNSSFVNKVIMDEARLKRTVVIDAGVISALRRGRRTMNRNVILTPHDGEFKTLTGVDLKGKDLVTRMTAAKSFAKRHGYIVVLKGHATVITDGDRLKINIAETPALATMGTGDVLSGMIASYAAQRGDRFMGAVAAVHLHSLIGDMLYKKKGMHITAQDVIDTIPDVLKRFDVIRSR